jgi:putative ABC transport system permease protein
MADRSPAIEVNEQHVEYSRHHTRTFESVAHYIVQPANLTGIGDATPINVPRVSGSLFDVLQVPAALGRTLKPADEPSDRPEVAVITDATWRQRFGADGGIIGRALVPERTPYTIVGVLRPDFRLPTERLTSNGEAFVPIHMHAERVDWWGDHNTEAIGRLRAAGHAGAGARGTRRAAGAGQRHRDERGA